MTETQATIGKILFGTHGRDAIHIAVLPTIANEKLYAGQNVGANGDSNTPVGIVDPFLKEPVYPGQQFWLFLYPNTITSLRHEWTHPTVDTQPTNARRRLVEIASALDLTYNAMMRAAEAWLEFGDYAVQQGSEHWRDTFPEYVKEFWPLYEAVTGKTIDTEKRENFFSCSC